jgi:hypothetical protein
MFNDFWEWFAARYQSKRTKSAICSEKKEVTGHSPQGKPHPNVSPVKKRSHSLSESSSWIVIIPNQSEG